MGIVGKTERRSAERGPTIGGRAVHFRNHRWAPITVYLSSGHEHASIRECGDRWVPSIIGHGWTIRPGLRDRIEEVGDIEPDMRLKMSTDDQEPPVRQLGGPTT